jgi:hypothetical protein
MQDNTPTGGRGSMVWFTQATMLQTAELGQASIKRVKAVGSTKQCSINTNYDVKAGLESDIFPFQQLQEI